MKTIELDPADWYRATWRELPPLPKPPAAPFDRDDALRRLKRVRRQLRSRNRVWDWTTAQISPSLSRPEAAFWLRAILASASFDDGAEIAAAMGDGEVEIALPDLLDSGALRTVPELAMPIAALFGAEGPVDLLLLNGEHQRKQGFPHWPLSGLIEGVRLYVRPYLTADELARLREKALQAYPPPSQWPQTLHSRPDQTFHLGAIFGLHDAVRPVVESWPDDGYRQAWSELVHEPQELIFGLGSAREVETHMRRLKLPLRTSGHIRAWLAHTETSALEEVRDSIVRHTEKEKLAELVPAFALVRTPEAAPLMLELTLTPRTARTALEWIQANPEVAATGLLPVAAGRGTLAQDAIDVLRSLKRRGLEPFLREQAERLDPDVRERVRAAVLDRVEKTYTELDARSTPEWLRAAAPKKKAPAWIAPDDLPPITLGDSMLNRDQTAAVLEALRGSKLGQPHPLVSALRANADPDPLDRFAWRLFELWLMNGAESKENWAMAAVGLLGGDASALKLPPMIRVWPGESQHARAVLGLECLRAIGSDTALMQINGIAQKLKFKGLKAKAAECMEKIAGSRGLTRAQLEDRIVPDCDLDERGSRVFDFGSRRFTFVLGPDMKPLVRDESGKAKPDLPKPGAKDDPRQSAAAVADWKLLKKQIAEVAKIQAVRLEQAMVTGRRWSGEELDLLLVRHPLMTNLVRLVVWGVYEEGRLAATFRVTEDQTLADRHDRVFALPPDARVGIAHPLQMADADRSAWAALLTDYEIIPPFLQLGRPTLALEDSEMSACEIRRFADIEVPAQTLVYTFEKLGWDRGIPQDGGIYSEHTKPFHGADVTAVVEYEGVPVYVAEGWQDQSIARCFFLPGIYKQQMYPGERTGMPLASVHPIAISEVLSDLTQIVSKVK
jgi:hypothetical protein